MNERQIHGGMSMDYQWRYRSPLGGMTMAGSGEALTGLWFDGQKYFGSGLPERSPERETPVFVQTVRWLDQSFGGLIPEDAPPLCLNGTPFQRAVWRRLLGIPYGRTVTYGELARAVAADLKLPRMSAQAVGGAVGRNPVSLIVPCHRVVGRDGRLTGYAAGIERKIWLLEREGVALTEKGVAPEVLIKRL